MSKVANIFEAITRTITAIEYEQLRKNQVEAAKWFQEHIQTYYEKTVKSAVHETFHNHKFRGGYIVPTPGKMYSFFYDPKGKDQLPYYDSFPLVVVLEVFPQDKSFTGLNLHYLDYKSRLRLFEALENHRITSIKNPTNTRLLIKTEDLKKSNKYRGYKECIRRYQPHQLRSTLIQIDTKDWITAIFLPTERFNRSSKSAIWAESRKRIEQA